jgi:hypothetical protein
MIYPRGRTWFWLAIVLVNIFAVRYGWGIEAVSIALGLVSYCLMVLSLLSDFLEELSKVALGKKS